VKCLKCGYTSFDYLKECKKCGENLEESRRALNLKASEPILFNKIPPFQEVQESETQKALDDLPENIDLSLTDNDFSRDYPASLASSSQISANSATEKHSPDDFFSDLGSLENEETFELPPQRGEFELHQLAASELENNIRQDNEIELSPTFMCNSEEKQLDREIDLLSETEMKKNEVKEAKDRKTTEDDLPFSFTSGSHSEDELNFNKSFAMEDDKFTELELDLEDEESLDQILADLEKKK